MQPSVATIVQDPQRLAALHELGLLDTPAEQAFDRLARLAARILRTPVALVSLVDSNRQFFKSCIGLPEPWSQWRETPLSHSFCQHVVASGQPLVIPDARRDPALLDNLAIRDLNVIAYLGSPLVLPSGQVIGSFCVIDSRPRDWTDGEVAVVRDLAASVMSEIELRHLHDSVQEQARQQAAEMTAALRESEERNRDLVDSSLDLICTHDLAGRLLSVNPRAGDMLGYRPEELVGMNMRDVIVPAHRAEFDDYLAEIRRKKIARGYLKVQTRLGETRVWYYENTLRTESVAQPIVRGTAHDVTRQHEADRKLRESETLYRELTELAADGIFISGPEGRFVVVNAAGCALSGYSREELSRLNITDLIPQDDLRHNPLRLDELRTGRSLIRERRLLRKDGAIVPVEVSVKQLPGGRIQGIVRDITDRKRAEAVREQYLAELTVRNTEMENFVYTISHDLKSPLITIGGFATLLEKDMARGEKTAMADSIAEINKAVGQMRDLIHALLLLSRTGRVKSDKEDVQLNSLLDEVIGQFDPRIQGVGAQLAVAPDLPVIRVDRKGFTRVFTNLIDNALKFRRPGSAPRIEIGWRLAGSELQLFVRDNGPGIKKEFQQRIFGLFQRADSETEGTGVGLAISKRVIDVHGGRLWVESQTGQGSTFWIGLPETSIVRG